MGSEQIMLSVGLGVGLGLAYIFASYVSNQLALRSTQFMLIVVGAMMLRMFIALVLLAVVLLMLPVANAVFLGGFFVVFGIGLVIEVVTLHRRKLDADAGRAETSGLRTDGSNGEQFN